MNWYSVVKTIAAKPLLKTAAAESPAIHHFDGQDYWDASVGDIQRWVVDAIDVKLFLVKTPYKITVCANVYNGHLSEMVWQDFWKFGVGQMKEARSLFKKFCDKAAQVIEEFRKTESPNNLVHAYLRNELRNIDREHLPKTNIPTINTSLQIDYEKDWRSTIYGTRYPTRDTSAF